MQSTQTTTSKKQAVLPYCLQCKKRFRAKTKTKKYCTNECLVASRNAKRKTTSKKKASANPFFYWLASEVTRSGSLQILQDHSKESLLELVALYKTHQRYNGYGERAELGLAPFEMSHILPVKHPTLLGLLRADNLVIAPKAMNRAHGTKYFGCGRGISRLTLSPKNAISKEAARSTVVQRIISYLGASLVDGVVREANLQPSKRHQLTEWLLANLIPTNKEHKAHLKALDDMTTISMSKLKAQLRGKVEEEEEGEGEAASFDLRVSCAYTDTQVLLAEWKRLSSYRADILPAYEHIELMQRMTGFKFRASFSASDAQLVFDMLHGKEVSHAYPVLESQYTLAKSKGCAVHQYIIPVKDIPSAIEVVASATIVQLFPEALQSAPKTFRDFAEEADAEMEQLFPQAIVERYTSPVYDEDEDEFEFELVPYKLAA